MTDNKDLPDDAIDHDAPTDDVVNEAVATEKTAAEAEAIKSKAARITPIRIAIGIAAVAAIWTVHREVKAAIEEPKVSFTQIEAVSDIDAALDEIGVRDLVMPLTKGDGKIDIIYAGAPECSYCQDFVAGADGYAFTPLDDLVTFANDEGLDLVYMPLALSNLGAAIGALEECAVTVSALDKVEMVKASYALVADLTAVSSNAQAAVEGNKPDEEIREIFKAGLSDAYEKLAPGHALEESCYVEAGSTGIQRMNAFLSRFGSYGTPSFYFTASPGVVEQFSGAGGLEPMMKILED